MIVGKVDQVSKEIYNLLDFIPHNTQKFNIPAQEPGQITPIYVLLFLINT